MDLQAKKAKNDSRRWLPRFGLRALLIGFVFLGLIFAWIHRVHSQRQTAQVVDAAGGTVYYDYELDERGHYIQPMMQFHWLEELDVSECDVSDEGLTHLSQAPSLTILYLFGTPITDAGMASVAEISRLKEPSLGYTGLTDAGLLPLVRLPELEVLDLQGTSITDAAIPVLLQMPALKWVDLCETHVTESGIKALKSGKPDILVAEPNFTGDSNRRYRPKIPPYSPRRGSFFRNLVG